MRLKALAIVAALLCACHAAAAQQTVARQAERAKSTRVHARAARPIAIPEETAPPQEAFASMPEQEPAAPAAPSECDAQLAKIAVLRPMGELVAPGECGAPDAVELQSVILPDATRVAVAPPATLRCTMALEVAQWIREDVAPAAAKLGAPLRGLENLGSYECRGRDRVRGATLSEHGRANALDVRSFKLASGAVFVLADTKVSKDFRDAVRASACARFATVLGPGSDEDHAEHVHVDLAPRRNNYKVCEWDVIAPVAPAQAQAQTEAQTRAPAPPIAAGDVPLPRPRPIAASLSKRTK
jgi:hypothetical protein